MPMPTGALSAPMPAPTPAPAPVLTRIRCCSRVVVVVACDMGMRGIIKAESSRSGRAPHRGTCASSRVRGKKLRQNWHSYEVRAIISAHVFTWMGREALKKPLPQFGQEIDRGAGIGTRLDIRELSDSTAEHSTNLRAVARALGNGRLSYGRECDLHTPVFRKYFKPFVSRRRIQ